MNNDFTKMYDRKWMQIFGIFLSEQYGKKIMVLSDF